MADTIPSTNMNMPVPIVSQAPGPDWATDINACLAILDAHDHSAGNGVQITPAGMNINSDLSFGSNNATALRSVRMTSQSAVLALAADLDCLYVVSGDLYYNDGSGNNVRITQSGAVAGTPGSIANLVSPASASYVAADSTFVFQSAANTPATLDGASLILRNLTANSKGLTLSPPNAMGSNYTIVLPSLPGSGTKFVSMDSSGNQGASWAVDGTTLEVSSNNVRVKDSGISTAKIADQAITYAKQAMTSISFAAGSSYSNSTTTYTNITGLSVTITASGNRPVMVYLSPGSGTQGVGASNGAGTVASGFIKFLQDGVSIGEFPYGVSATGASAVSTQPPTGGFVAILVPAAGSHTYTVQGKRGTGTMTTDNGLLLNVVEL